jgi:hypothetical protein
MDKGRRKKNRGSRIERRRREEGRYTPVLTVIFPSLLSVTNHLPHGLNIEL